MALEEEIQRLKRLFENFQQELEKKKDQFQDDQKWTKIYGCVKATIAAAIVASVVISGGAMMAALPAAGLAWSAVGDAINVQAQQSAIT